MERLLILRVSQYSTVHRIAECRMKDETHMLSSFFLKGCHSSTSLQFSIFYSHYNLIAVIRSCIVEEKAEFQIAQSFSAFKNKKM